MKFCSSDMLEVLLEAGVDPNTTADNTSAFQVVSDVRKIELLYKFGATDTTKAMCEEQQQSELRTDGPLKKQEQLFQFQVPLACLGISFTFLVAQCLYEMIAYLCCEGS